MESETLHQAATLSVPLLWLVSAIVVLGGAFIAVIGTWLSREMRRNDGEHEQLKRQIDRVLRRVDYIIMHNTPAIPQFKEEEG